MKQINWSRKKVIACTLVFAVLALSSGVYFWKVKADSVAGPGVKIQLTDISGKEVKAPVLLEMLVYGKVRVCQRVKVAFAKISQCSTQDRAYTRYAATDANGTYIVPVNIGKPLSDTELRDTLQKVVYSSGKNLASDDVDDIIENVKNIKVDDNPTFFMQAVQVVGAAYASKFSSDLVNWTATQIKNATTHTSSTTANKPSGSTSTTSSTNAPTQAQVTDAAKEVVGGDAAKQNLAANPSVLPAVPANATPDDLKKIASESAGQANANIEMGVQKLSQLDVATATKAGQIALNEVIADQSSSDILPFADYALPGTTSSGAALTTNLDPMNLSGFGGMDSAKKFLANINNTRSAGGKFPTGSEKWSAGEYKDWYNNNLNKTDAVTVDMKNRLAMIAIGTAGSDQTLTNSLLKNWSAQSIPVTKSFAAGTFTSGSQLADIGNNIHSVLVAAQKSAADATAAGALAKVADTAQKIQSDPAKADQIAPANTALAKTDTTAQKTDTKTKKKRNVVGSFMQGMFSTVVQTSLKAGALIIPDPVSLGFALVYQAIGPKYEVIERDFKPSNVVVSTLSERFDSGRIRIDFADPASTQDNSSSTKSTGVMQYFRNSSSVSSTKQLQVVFRDEELYNTTTASFLAKAFEATTDSSSRSYMTGILGNYKDYLLETQLRGTADTDATITDSIKKIGNLSCPAPAAPAPTN